MQIRVLNARRAMLIAGFAVIIAGILFGAVSHTYTLPMIIIACGITVALIMGFGPMLRSDKAVMIIATIGLTFPATVIMHEFIHFLVGSAIWPGKMGMGLSFMEGVTVANVTPAEMSAVNEWAVWFFFASAPLISMIIAIILMFIQRISLYVGIFGVFMLFFTMFTLWPVGGTDLGQASTFMIQSGGDPFVVGFVHNLFFIASLVILGTRILFTSFKQRVI